MKKKIYIGDEVEIWDALLPPNTTIRISSMEYTYHGNIAVTGYTKDKVRMECALGGEYYEIG